MTPRELLRAMFDAAIASAQPAVAVPPHLPDPASVKGRLVVIGAGKASAAMARAVEQHWQGPREQLTGLVVTRYGYSVPCERTEIIEAAHPVPDEAGLKAAERLKAFVQGLSEDDVVLCLISGGGSALLPAPAPGLTLADKQDINAQLLKSGASIGEMNCVRRHLSTIKGGRLAALCHPARVLTLLISDVPGDQLPDIASGPTVADPSTCADALALLQRYRITVPPAARALLESGEGETLKPGDARLARCETRLISSPQIGLAAAAQVARAAGLGVCILGDSLEGEAREVGRVMAGIAQQVATHGQPLAAPCVLLSGGETTVTVRGQGRGGRNVEFLLSLGVALKGAPGIWALAGDTDGVDGIEEIAGALLAPDTLARARALGIKATASLDDNDGHGFFGALGDAVVTGPTLTNINDFRAVLIARPSTFKETSMDLPVNHFKRALKEGKPQIGLWSHLCSNISTEILGHCGLDWLVLDMEHSPNELDTILSQLQALQTSKTMPVVRPPWNDMVTFKRLLDVGAQTLIVPYIQNEEEARNAVAYTRYPPHGVRGYAGAPRASGYGRIKDYAQRCSEEICLLLQIETLEGLKHLEAIASIEGVDGIFIGPGDLSADMGHLGNPKHPEVVKVVEDAFKRIRACGKAPGILIGDEALARHYIAIGGLFVAVGADQNVLRDGVTQLVGRFKA